MTARARTAPAAALTPAEPAGSRCKSDRCGAAVRWVKTPRGKWMPLDIDRCPDGTVVAEQLARNDWRFRVMRHDEQVDPTRPRYSPHWSTCPEPGLWAQTRREADPAGDSTTARARSRWDTWACAGCRWPYHVVDGVGTLCEVCSPILAAWRALPGPHRGPIPYPRWNEDTEQREPTAFPGARFAPALPQAAPADPPPAPVAPARPALTVVEPAPRPAGTLLVVDGPSLAHRAWYAYEKSAMTAADGTPIHAVYGFLALLAGIIDRTDPDAVLVGWDDRTSSIRRQWYPEYKAGRVERDPDLYAQQAIIATVVESLGVPRVVPTGLEADDVLGSAAAAAEAAGWRCVIATSDKDSFALITEATTVLRLVNGLDNAVRMTPAKLVETYGVRPDQYLDYSALVGDDSDHLRGVLGIGVKTAAKLLAALGSVDAALADPEATAKAVGKAGAAKLRTEQATAALDRNRKIMAIRRDLPVDLERCRLRTTPDMVATVLEALHLPKLVARVTGALCRTTPTS
ncbi:hypothetical protein JNW90_24295 [Micromonospora sp. STR1s_5]|nr:hypothetical protein [Micromonospora sp. STR1s_5]